MRLKNNFGSHYRANSIQIAHFEDKCSKNELFLPLVCSDCITHSLQSFGTVRLLVGIPLSKNLPYKDDVEFISHSHYQHVLWESLF